MSNRGVESPSVVVEGKEEPGEGLTATVTASALVLCLSVSGESLARDSDERMFRGWRWRCQAYFWARQ